MLIIIYAVVLIFFWIRATYIKPAWYTNANPEHVHAWRAHRLKLYRSYAALVIIWILLAIGNGYLAGYISHHHHVILWHHVLAVTVGISMIYAILILVYPGYHCYHNFKVRQLFKTAAKDNSTDG